MEMGDVEETTDLVLEFKLHTPKSIIVVVFQLNVRPIKASEVAVLSLKHSHPSTEPFTDLINIRNVIAVPINLIWELGVEIHIDVKSGKDIPLLVSIGLHYSVWLVGVGVRPSGIGVDVLNSVVERSPEEFLGYPHTSSRLYYSGSRRSGGSGRLGRLGRHWEGKRHSRLGGLWLCGALFDGVGQTISIFDGRRMVLPTLYYKPENLIALLSAGVIGYRC